MKAISYPEADKANDQSLPERIRKGDMLAFARFYDVHAPLLYGFIRKIIPDEHKAGEVLQAVFLELRRQLLAGREQVATSLSEMLRIARGIALEQKKASGSATVLSKSLPPLELICFNGLTVAEAAGKLNTSTTEIRRQIKLALQKFRNQTSG